MEPYFDLGTYTRGTSTASTSAQTWFDRGLVWSYAFHHEEAIRCFERAVEHDPGFAPAHWGIAYAIGPNYNKQWEAFDPVDLAASLEKACDEVAAARACADRAAPVERALVEALGSRYQANDPSADLVAWNADYADAMRDVYRAHSDELDVAALFADALMNLTPWALWDRYTGLPSEGAATLEAKEVLERALERPGGRTHPGLVHLYVHLMEMSPFPEQALPVADELRSLVPDAGHLVHMPTHIDVLCGDYKSTLEWNLRAIEVNEKYVAREGRVGFYALYHAHDRHFAIYGAMFLGRSQVALRVAADLEASLPEELLRIEQPPMADYLEAYAQRLSLPVALETRVRGVHARHGHLVVSTDGPAYEADNVVVAMANHQRAAVPHHLLDLASPDEPFTVADWVERARALLPPASLLRRHPASIGRSGSARRRDRGARAASRLAACGAAARPR